jgi:hypothetical protein
VLAAILCFFVIPAVVITTSVMQLLLTEETLETGMSLQPLKTLVTFLIFPAIGLFVLRMFSRRQSRDYGWDTFFRLTRFALDNGLSYRPTSPRPSYPGLLFGHGLIAEVYNHLTSVEGRYFDLGNYSVALGRQDGLTTQAGHGFIAINLDRRLPNIVLKTTKRNGVISHLPVSVVDANTVQLEGNFNDAFTLHCPVGYERDALYVLTPDLMTLLIDETASFDVELVDDWMFVYSSEEFDLTDPELVSRLFRILDTVGDKAVTQTRGYRDERIGSYSANIVAPPGRRVLRGLRGSMIALIVFVSMALVAAFLIPGYLRHSVTITFIP